MANIHAKSKMSWLLVASAAALIVVQIASESVAEAAIACPIRLGTVYPESGAVASVGLSLGRGLKMGFNEINAKGGITGCQVEVISYDSQSQPANAVTLTQRLLFQDNVKLIIGSAFSLEVLAMMEVTGNAKVPLYVPSAASALITSQGSKWVWRQSVTDLAAAKLMAGYLVKDLNWKRIGIVFENSDYGKIPIQKVAIPAIQAAGGVVAAQEAVNIGDVDLSSQLLRVRDAKVDGLLFWGHDKEGALLLKQNQQLGLNLKLAANTGVVYAPFLDLLPADVQDKTDMVAVTQFVWTTEDPKQKDWIAAYKKLFSKDPDATAIDAYDATYFLKKAIEVAGSMDAEPLQKAFNTVKYDGVGGNIAYDSSGQALRPLVIVRLTPKSGRGFRVIRTIQP
jgi:branched-chain amino acid transport system substrate-binding protein